MGCLDEAEFLVEALPDGVELENVVAYPEAYLVVDEIVYQDEEVFLDEVEYLQDDFVDPVALDVVQEDPDEGLDVG